MKLGYITPILFLLILFIGCKKEETIHSSGHFEYTQIPLDGATGISPYLKLTYDVYLGENTSQAKIKINLYRNHPDSLFHSYTKSIFSKGNKTEFLLMHNTCYYLETKIIYSGIRPLNNSDFEHFKDTVYHDKISFCTEYIDNMEFVKDIEGNIYTTTQIGNQSWFINQLKTKTFNDGQDASSFITDSEATTSDIKDPIPLIEYSGKIFTENRNICPTGWRVPTKEDFDTLLYYMENTYGDLFTEELLIHRNNSTNFSFISKRYYALWSQTPYSNDTLYTWALYGPFSYLNKFPDRRLVKDIIPSDQYLPIKCIKDE